MVTPHHLRKIAKKANEAKKAAEIAEAERKQAEKMAAEEEQTARRIREWPVIIEAAVEAAASRGEFRLEYDIDDCGSKVEDHLKSHFADLDPEIVRQQRSRVVNYDTGVDEEYYTWVLILKW